MVEETMGILRRNRLQCSAYRLDQRLAGASPGFAQQRLYLGKRFFYWVEVGRVWWQVEKLAAPLLYELSNPPTFVRREVVHHHYLPRPKRGHQDSFQVGLEHLPRGRPFNRQARTHPFHAHARQHADVRSPVAWHRTKCSLSSSRPSVQG